MRTPPWLLILLAACGEARPVATPTSPGPQQETGEPTPDSPDNPDGTDDTDGSADTAIEQIGGVPDDGCPAIYDQAILPTFSLEIDESAWAGLLADYATGVKDYHPARFAYESEGGEILSDLPAAVRLKGNPGFSWLGEKMQFVISFNEQDPDARFQGLRKLALDASWYDPSMLRDRLAYAWLRHRGLTAACANSAKLYINGEYYGLYKNVEYLDHEFLERSFGDDLAGGVLWKYGSEAVANEDKADPAVIAAFWGHAGVQWQEIHTDLDGNLDQWASEALLPHNDGYWCCNHNFYLYEHPTEGIQFVPWDMDYTLDAAPFWADPYTWYRDSNAQYHLDAVAADPEWGPRFEDALAEATADYDPDLMAGWIDAWSAQIADAMAADPRTNFSVPEHQAAIERLRAYVYARRGWMESWSECRGAPEDADADGYASCEDCDDGEPGINPGAAEGCNLRDDDCDGQIDEGAGCDTCEEHAFGDSRLLLCTDPVPWEQARARCQSRGGDLGFPKTTEDWYVFFIHTYWHYTYWAGIYTWWAGASDAASEGTWLDPAGASAAPWAGWAGGEPGGGTAENCAALSPNSWTWYDEDCSLAKPAICRL